MIELDIRKTVNRRDDLPRRKSPPVRLVKIYSEPVGETEKAVRFKEKSTGGIFYLPKSRLWRVLAPDSLYVEQWLLQKVTFSKESWEDVECYGT